MFTSLPTEKTAVTNIVLLATLLFALCLPGVSAASQSAFDFIQPGKLGGKAVFETQAWHNGKDVFVGFSIPEDHYLYRKHFNLEPGTLGPLRTPEGAHHSDEFFGDVEIFRNRMVIASELSTPITDETSSVDVTAHYQGCSDKGICFPPVSELLTAEYRSIAPSDFFLEVSDVPDYAVQQEVFKTSSSRSGIIEPPAPSGSETDSSDYLSVLKDADLATVMGLFFLAGLALTFTPCVLPMVPIMSAMIVGQSTSRSRALTLSISYVAGMAATYTTVGILMGLFGASLNIQAKMQSPVVLAVFAGIFILLAMALAGGLNVQMSPGIASRVNAWQDRAQRSGSIGIAIAGALSVLVVSPCVSAPLAGAMVFISSTGDAQSGGLALLAMAIGMGIPLILVGTFGATLLPKRGAWMNTVKSLFSLMMFATGIWLLDRILPAQLTLLAWAALLISIAMTLGMFAGPKSTFGGRVAKGASVFPMVWACALILSAASGGSNPIQPLEHFAMGSQPHAVSSAPVEVTELAELNALVSASEKPVFVQLTADWCATCKTMESRYQAPEVAKRLKQFTVIKADVTENSTESGKLMDAFNAFGPPAVIVYRSGSEEYSKVVNGELTEPQLVTLMDSFID